MNETRRGAGEEATEEATSEARRQPLSKELVPVPAGIRWEGTDWRADRPVGADGKFDLGQPGSVRDDVVRGLREEFRQRGVPDALSPEFLSDTIEPLDLSEFGAIVDGDGPLAPDRLALTSDVIEKLRQLGSLVADGRLGGVAVNTMRSLEELGPDFPKTVDCYCVAGLQRRLSGGNVEVDPVLARAIERYGKVRDELLNDRNLLHLLVSDRSKVANHNPVADPERLQQLSEAQLGEERWHLPTIRGRDVVVPLDYADPRHHGTIEETVRAVAERHGVTRCNAGDGLVRAQDAALKAKVDKGMALRHWGETRRLAVVAFLDDVDKTVAAIPSEGAWSGPDGPGVLLKIAPISPRMSKERSMADAPDLAAYLYGGPEGTARFLQSIWDLAVLQAAPP